MLAILYALGKLAVDLLQLSPKGSPASNGRLRNLPRLISGSDTASSSARRPNLLGFRGV
jgi:hypothetical protein